MNNLQQDKKSEYPAYVEGIKRHFGAVVHLLWFVSTETSDKGADIAARALALLAPLPNAVSVYNVSQTSLGYTQVQAFAFAMAMELALFAIIEVALHMWDGVLGNRKRYAVPLGVSIVASVGMLIIVMSVVYNLEVMAGGSWVLALLPLVSLFAFVALGLKRWHERNPDLHATQPRKKDAKTQPATPQAKAQDVALDAPIIALPSVVLEAYNMRRNGMTIPQIAERIGKSERSVNNYLAQAKAQLNGHNIAEVQA